MPEFRKDPVIGRWVIISTERARRPGNVVDKSITPHLSGPTDCLYCRFDTPPVIALCKNGKPVNGRPWDVAVVPFQNSFFNREKPFVNRGHGLYSVGSAFGIHDVVIETSDHIANMADLEVGQIKLVIDAYAKRMQMIEEETDLQFLMAFKNFGSSAGSRKIEHARSHVMATPINPLRINQKFAGARQYFQEHKSCIFCDLIDQELQTKSRIVLESPHFIVLAPFAARFLFELQILPKEHNCDFYKGVRGVEEDLAGVIKILLQKFKVGLDDPAYNYVFQTAPIRRQFDEIRTWASINEDFHWHIEISPRLTQIAGFEKGTGFYICPIPPEAAAEYLRGVEI